MSNFTGDKRNLIEGIQLQSAITVIYEILEDLKNKSSIQINGLLSKNCCHEYQCDTD
jgi:hypothetical protein